MPRTPGIAGAPSLRTSPAKTTSDIRRRADGYEASRAAVAGLLAERLIFPSAEPASTRSAASAVAALLLHPQGMLDLTPHSGPLLAAVEK
ncbi:hypothetical protein PAPYR_11321 [Paratrimastix pyriformis]|uniref:Uncharacterized protein n=1 Tax=Paratrimastix pyriformis TaxID=342808 RepID=A0ABQ8UB62_9EUKA|nr:hypothetical protein PAPYR_11321 [Paratrimastix pyriformis]